MEFNIVELKELESGGAEIIVEMDDETKKYLLNFAVLELIKNGLTEVKELHDGKYKDEG